MNESMNVLVRVEDHNGCFLSGKDRGDCAHFVGLPGKSIPGLHDGDDDTVDEYGKPNGWCWSCWKSNQLEHKDNQLELARAVIQPAEALYGFAAWLTTRSTPTLFGSSEDCSPVGQALKEFCEANGFADPRERWEDQVVFPKKENQQEGAV